MHKTPISRIANHKIFRQVIIDLYFITNCMYDAFLWIIKFFYVRYSFPFLGIVCCRSFIMSTISSVIHSFICLVFFSGGGMISFAAVPNVSFNMLPLSFCILVHVVFVYNFGFVCLLATWILRWYLLLQFRRCFGLL